MDLDAFPGAAARRALLAAALVLAFEVAHGVPGAREAAAAEPLAWVAPDSARRAVEQRTATGRPSSG